MKIKCIVVIILITLTNFQYSVLDWSINNNFKRIHFLNNANIILKSFNASTPSPYKVILSWSIEGNISNLYVEIVRRFLTSESTIGILPASEKSFEDKWVYFGTEYYYSIRIIDENYRVLALSRWIRVVTPISKNDPRAPKYSWYEYKKRKYPYWRDIDFNKLFNPKRLFLYRI